MEGVHIEDPPLFRGHHVSLVVDQTIDGWYWEQLGVVVPRGWTIQGIEPGEGHLLQVQLQSG